MKLDRIKHADRLTKKLNEVSHDLLETSPWKATQRIELELKKISLMNELTYVKNK